MSKASGATGSASKQCAWLVGARKREADAEGRLAQLGERRRDIEAKIGALREGQVSVGLRLQAALGRIRRGQIAAEAKLDRARRRVDELETLGVEAPGGAPLEARSSGLEMTQAERTEVARYLKFVREMALYFGVNEREAILDEELGVVNVSAFAGKGRLEGGAWVTFSSRLSEFMGVEAIASDEVVVSPELPADERDLLDKVLCPGYLHAAVLMAAEMRGEGLPPEMTENDRREGLRRLASGDGRILDVMNLPALRRRQEG